MNGLHVCNNMSVASDPVCAVHRQDLKSVVKRTVSDLGTTGSHLCFMWIMWFCWYLWTFKVHWGSFVTECAAAVMRVSSSKSEVMALWKWGNAPSGSGDFTSGEGV